LLSEADYNPKARPPTGSITFWDRLRNDSEADFRREWVEFDLYENAASVMEDFIVDSYNASHTLRNIAASGKPAQFFTLAEL
jgi:hypothetical protein